MRKAYTTAELRELAKEPADAMHPHLLDAQRDALRYAADVIDAANEALRPSVHQQSAKGLTMGGEAQ
jgi:hypothetical protein